MARRAVVATLRGVARARAVRMRPLAIGMRFTDSALAAMTHCRASFSTEFMLRDECGHISTSRSIPTAMAGVMFGRPRGADRSEIVRSPASNESAYRDHGDHHGAADNPENR